MYQMNECVAVNTQKTQHKNISVFYTLFYVFTFMTMFFPDSYRVFRLGLLMILFILSIYRNKTIRGRGIPVLGLFLLVNIICMIWGLLNGAPGALRGQTVDLLWPVFFFLIGQNILEDEYQTLIRVIVFSYFCVCTFDVFYVLTTLIGLSVPLLTPLFQTTLYEALGCRIGNFGSFIQYTTTHMCTIMYMIPFMACLLVDKNRIIKRSTVVVILGLSAVCVLCSGRVALIVISMVCPVLGMLMMNESRRISWKSIKHIFKIVLLIIVAIAAVIVLCNLIGVEIGGVVQYVEEKFRTSRDPSNLTNGVRIIQKNALIKGWMDSPILGHGSGSYANSIIRDAARPWAYEYSYYAMLFQKGIIGAFATFGLYGWILYSLLRCRNNGCLKTNIAVPFFIGFVSILICNHADPYLAKLGCMWMIYYPFSIVNNCISNGNVIKL